MNTQQPKALLLADILEHPSVPLAVEHATAAELRRLHRVELAYQQWSDKTEWVQGTGDGSELGMHIADVLKQRIERLTAANTELLTQLQKALDSLEYVQQTFPGNAGCGVRHERIRSAQATIAKAQETV